MLNDTANKEIELIDNLQFQGSFCYIINFKN